MLLKPFSGLLQKLAAMTPVCVFGKSKTDLSIKKFIVIFPSVREVGNYAIIEQKNQKKFLKLGQDILLGY